MQTVETLNEGLKRAYSLTIPAADIEQRIEAEVKAAAPQIRMPGFRPGKVPANLVRKMHGPALRQDALNKAIQEGVQNLLAEKKLRPAMQPAVELSSYDEGKDAELSVSLEVLPEIATPSIEGLKLERLQVEADESAVDEQVNRLVQQQKSYGDSDPERAAETGDLVIMDFAGKSEGVAFEGGTGEDMSVEIGSGRLIPGFEDQLVGVKVGDEKTISVTFPEDYGAKNLAGKPATFNLKIKEVKVAKEGVADDDFAKSLGLESLEQLRGLFKGQVEQELNGLTRTHMKRKLLDQLAEAHSFDVPPSMVEAEFQQIWQQLEHEAGHEEDPEAAKADLEKDREDYLKIAERRVRLGLLLSEIGQANGVEVSGQEMQRLIAQAAQQYAPADRERFVQYVQNEPMAAAQLRAPLYEDKVVDFLFGKAEITDRTVTREELEAAIEADLDVKADGGHVHGPDCGHDHHDHDHDHAPAKKKPAAKKAKAADVDGEAVSDEPVGEEASAEPAPKKTRAKKAAEPAAEGDEAAEAPAKKPRAKKAAAAE
ncbi:trigger factor [Sphingomonas sp. ID0503]|uniref:trigger factor n=1 Tax=Sphingomonas sp. ID0503 TaxID=3399691 RepID=UPI003AFB44C0